MNILFRADANSNIGQGHVMRMLSLADAMMAFDNRCFFVCALDTNAQVILERGYEVHTLSTDYDHMPDEIPELTKIIHELHCKIVIVDSYNADTHYLKALKKVRPVVYMEDIASFTRPVDVLVNYNINASEWEYENLYKYEKQPIFIIGPEYAPLRKDFANLSERLLKEEVRKIAVTFGGADPMHLALGFLKTLLESKQEVASKDFIFILGAMNPDIDEIKALASGKENIKIQVNVRSMKQLFMECDLAVSAAGSTQYEICACQVPCVNFSMADNQVPGGEEFGARGIFSYAGDARTTEDFFNVIIDKLQSLSDDYERRVRMVMMQHHFVDGNGAKRLAEKILELKELKRI